MIIGIKGRRGSGKTTVGSIIERAGYRKIAFADSLKEAAKIVFRLTDEQVYGPIEIKETVDERWDLSPRSILQLFGTNSIRAIHPDVWVNSVMFEIEKYPEDNWVIHDCRFINEARAIKNHHGLIIEVQRPGTGLGKFEEHQSEQEQSQIISDYIIYNNGSLKDLEQSVEFLFKQIAVIKNIVEKTSK